MYVLHPSFSSHNNRSEEQETQIKSMQKIIDKANSEQKQKISMTLANQEAAR